MKRSKLHRAVTSPYAPLVSFWLFFLVELCAPPTPWVYVALGALFAVSAISLWCSHRDLRALCAEAERQREEFRRALRG